jgi:hypothetical protein
MSRCLRLRRRLLGHRRDCNKWHMNGHNQVPFCQAKLLSTRPPDCQ